MEPKARRQLKSLTPEQRQAIRQKYTASGMSLSQLAQEYKVRTSTIWYILRHTPSSK